MRWGGKSPEESPGPWIGTKLSIAKGDDLMKRAAGSILVLVIASVLWSTLDGPIAIARDNSLAMDTVRIYSVKTGDFKDLDVVHRSAEEWRKTLTANQYRILREEGTEPPFRNAFWDNHREGIYRCAGCGTDLFSSTTKFKSGTGWPSFWEPVASGNIKEVEDKSFFMSRIEVQCARCGGHLGHVFNDGPPPTGLRYCINSESLTFVEVAVDISPMSKEG
jgi:peptide-methionine (R)-S-oxide reductase